MSSNVQHWIHQTLLLTFLCVIVACTPHPENAQLSNELPPMYPDYTDITIPANIAPLNFILRGDIEAVELKASCNGEELKVNSNDNTICMDMDDWKALLAKSAGKDINVTVTAMDANGRWTEYKGFRWSVAEEPIDPYLTYRLIEPDYEIFNNLEIEERCVESFETRPLSTYRLVGNRCMNCHVHSQQPDVSMMYVRGEGGGAILNEHGNLRKLNIKTDDMEIGSVYAGFDPSCRYVVFSTNVILPSFHSKGSKRMEVFDQTSDVYVADLHHNKVLRTPLLCDSTQLETFPTFSPDGKFIYYCTAPVVEVPQNIKDLQYSLCRISFDEQTGTFGTKADTLVVARKGTKQSVCHPRISPDGKWLLYSVADYGTFPIWHREADLRMMNLQTGKVDSLSIVNSNRSDTYHSWSSNSRWFVFASKRDDGLYGKPYFCYVDKNGNAHKPFVLPQKSPTFYDNFLKSYNVPDLGQKKMNFSAKDVMHAMDKELEGFE